MNIREAGILLWAVVATIAAIVLVLMPTPEVAPQKPESTVDRPTPRKRPTLPSSRSAGSLEGFLALALEPSAPEREDGRPVSEKVRAILKEYLAHSKSDDWTVNKFHEISRKMYALVARDTEAHLALMEMLAEAEDEDTAHAILGFLIWNPFVKSIHDKPVIDKIEAEARNMIANDPNVERREAATRVLFRYGGGGGREAFEFGLERLAAEPSAEVRDVLLEEMTVAGRDIDLTEEEAAPFADRLRGRLDEGEAWCANALAEWSTDPDDFRMLKERLATERDPRKRQDLLNAFSGEKTIVRDRTEEARAVLIGVLSDPAEDELVRMLARDFLGRSFGPLDAASTEAVRRYDAEQKGR